MLLQALFASSSGAASTSLAIGTLRKTSWTTGSVTFTSWKGADETHGLITTSSGTTVTDIKYGVSSVAGVFNGTLLYFAGSVGPSANIRVQINGGSWATFSQVDNSGTYYYEVSGDPLGLAGLANNQTVSFAVESV